MRTGIGALGWRPADFWEATLTEFFEGINGHNEAQGGEQEQAAPKESEMNALLARYG